MTVTSHEPFNSESDEDSPPIRVLFALPGLHRINRGAEVAFESVAQCLGQLPGFQVTMIGSGHPREGTAYEFRHAGAVLRTWFRNWPKVPLLRHDCMYEELTFILGLRRAYSPGEFDITVTCSYPYTNWLLRGRRHAKGLPRHIFVTQNGDWPLRARNREFRYFDCDGLICTNPGFYEAHRTRWNSELIPNGVDPTLFRPGVSERARFGLPDNQPIVLMVSALIPAKRVVEAVQAVAPIRDAYLVIAGDGPLANEVDVIGNAQLQGRYQRLRLRHDEMPALYRSADVFLHMAQNESFGNVYVEALSSGLPIVAEDCQLTRWALGDRATLVHTERMAEVTEALREVLRARSHWDPGRSHDEAAGRFSWDAIAHSYGEFFRRIVQRYRDQGRARTR
jgi:glycosyltransferase involved in cell wall biosynthesis